MCLGQNTRVHDAWPSGFRGDSPALRWYPETSESRDLMAGGLPNVFPTDLLPNASHHLYCRTSLSQNSHVLHIWCSFYCRLRVIFWGQPTTSEDTVVLPYRGDLRDNTAQPQEEPSHFHTNWNETGSKRCSQSGCWVGQNNKGKTPNHWSYPKRWFGTEQQQQQALVVILNPLILLDSNNF